MTAAHPSSITGGDSPNDRIPMWNTIKKTRTNGCVAPLRKNLYNYLAKNPHMELYTGQAEDTSTRILAHQMDSELSPRSLSVEARKKVPLWNKHELRLMRKCHHPLRKNVVQYLKANQQWELYDGQDERLQAIRSARVPLWHTIEKRKLRLFDSPLGKDVKSFLDDHPEWEVYYGQAGETLEDGNRVNGYGNVISPNGRIVMWDHVNRRKVSTAECPLPSELITSIPSNGQLQIYKGQDKIPPEPAPKGSSGPTDTSYKDKLHKMGPDGLYMDSRGRVMMWDTYKQKKVGGTAAPLRSNVESVIQRRPYLEVYRGQDIGNTPGGTSSNHSRSARPLIQREMRALDIEKFCTTNNPVSTLMATGSAPLQSQDPEAETGDNADDNGSIINHFLVD